MHRPLLVALALALTSACAAHEGAQPETDKMPRTEPDAPPVDPESEPEPEPEPEPSAKIAISSVTMVQDCGERRPAPSSAKKPSASVAPASEQELAADEPMPPAPGAASSAGASARRVGPGGALRQPCTQSTMQVSITETAGTEGSVAIKQVRLIRPDTGAVLATIEAREPTAWTDDGQYTPWDEALRAGAEVKASYKISVPDWIEVDEVLGQSSMGHMFALDVDFETGGVTQTVRSPEFTRERPHVIVT